MLLALLVLPGCSSFDREWRSAQEYAYPENEIAGCWEGSWLSNSNGHNGNLRAIITKQGENYYHAHFKATYAFVIPFEFEVPLMVTEDGGVYAFESQADLGWLAGGVYTYTGTTTPHDFSASYCAAKDHGTFTMSRLQTCTQCSDIVEAAQPVHSHHPPTPATE